MKNKTYKRDINKEIMFSKIMPTYSADGDNDYNDDEQDTRYVDSTQNTNQFNRNMNGMPSGQSHPDSINSFNNTNFFSSSASNVNSQNSFTAYSSFPAANNFSGNMSVSPNGFINASIPVSSSVSVQPQNATGNPISQNTENIHTTADNDEVKLINIIEHVVDSRLDNTMTTFKCCKCEECKKAVTLKVLNQTIPEYVYIKPSDVAALISSNDYKNLNQPMIRSILEVKANPPHTT